MGLALGIGIPAAFITLFVVLIVRSGTKKKKRCLALRRYAQSKGYQYVGDDLNGRIEGSEAGRRFSLEFAIVQCSADPAAGPNTPVPRMQRLETVLRMALPQTTCRGLVSKPFFRDAIHDPMRGAQPVDVGDASFQQVFRVLCPPGESLDWLDADARSGLLRLDARELRVDQGELSLNLDKMIASANRFDAALGLASKVASRIEAR